METLRRHPALASITFGFVAILAAIYFSPGGDIVVVSIAEVAAVALAIAMYVVLRRLRARRN